VARESRMGRNVGVGCFGMLMGFFSGGMFGVLLAKIVDFFTRAPSCSGLPSCHWPEFFFGGALIGALTLPTLILLRLRDSDRAADSSPRG
jgi:hypothetical protein